MPADAPRPVARRRPLPYRVDPHSSARLERLLEAQRTVTGDLALADLPERIVRAACDLVGARYGALLVLGGGGAPDRLVQHGADDAEVRRIHDRPGGLPPGRPDPDAFLRVPVRVGGDVFGDLYLTQPGSGGPGGERFGADDEELVTALAATAGTAIANARVYEDARRSQDWLNASSEITRALLADADTDMLLEVVSRALDVAEADYGALVLPVSDGTQMQVAVAVGVGADGFAGLIFDPARSEMGRVLTAGDTLIHPDLMALANPDFPNADNFGPVMIAPLVDAKGVRGAVLLLRTADRGPFLGRELDLLTAFADQVALALELDDARNDAEWLRVLEVRHRIAQDLHDNVIQRLFATGVGLQGLARAAVPAPLADRLGRHISDLDDTIDEIRERVFGLRENATEGVQRIRGRFPHVPRAADAPDDPRAEG